MTAPVPIGVVLAGGASRRMGRDKARLRLGPTNLVQRAASTLSAVVDVVCIADRGRQLVTGCDSVLDGPGRGPAAGILGAAAAHPGSELLVLACDLPAVSLDLLRHLATFCHREAGTVEAPAEAVVPRWSQGIEPLCALYRPAALDALAGEVLAGRFALHALLSRRLTHVRFLTAKELAVFGDPARLFANLNTPQDLAAMKRR